MTIKRINRGRGHSYSIDGKKAIGVTTALSEGMPKPALIRWAAKTVAQHVVDMEAEQWQALLADGRAKAAATLTNIPFKTRDEAAARGTAVHNIAERAISGEEIAVPEHLYGYVESAIAFMNDWQVTPVLVEKVVASYKFGFAGTFDVIGDVPDGRRILFDYKTSASGIWPETALQLAAYRNADYYLAEPGVEIPMAEVGITECKAVHLRADGYDVYPLDTSPETFSAFLACLAVARVREDMPRMVGAIETPGEYARSIAGVCA